MSSKEGPLSLNSVYFDIYFVAGDMVPRVVDLEIVDACRYVHRFNYQCPLGPRGRDKGIKIESLLSFASFSY